MQIISSVLEIIDPFEVILLDLWGVVHDGQSLYPGVRDAIINFKDKGKKIIFISNAPRRAHKAASVLASFGIETDMYDHVMTSGEAMLGWMQRDESQLGKSYYFIGPERDADILSGMDYQRSGLSQCDFILNVGYENDDQKPSDFSNILRTAAAMKKLMICANPDIEVVRQNGQRLGCAGELAEAYKDIGGYVKYFGKPYEDIYKTSLLRIGNIAKSSVIAVGDSLHTDIEGATNMGIDSVLITGGILKNIIHPEGQENIDEIALSKLINDGGNKANPKYICRSLA